MVAEVYCRDTVYIRWIFPPCGWYKLNSDGASKGNLVGAGCGGLVRDDAGTWVKGFGMHLGHCSAFTAELWGSLFLRALKMAW